MIKLNSNKIYVRRHHKSNQKGTQISKGNDQVRIFK